MAAVEEVRSALGASIGSLRAAIEELSGGTRAAARDILWLLELRALFWGVPDAAESPPRERVPTLREAADLLAAASVAIAAAGERDHVVDGMLEGLRKLAEGC